ncbi:DUF6124 family protein [Pseudomonas hamedanensis]|uniref:DUF3077 domain-containing protein n=1 Tax=Pseudomonas hamedanensis TaxID=2745504 RepID=A0A9E6P117_9PSED|nr:hypothetical protein [Pseudomonas hamedanensis]QXI17760.1 hypothetical protein HU739_001825 [Pseudomonas hamedanensis]
MFKVTPNPPEDDSIPYDPTLEPQRIKEAAARAINFYLPPKTSKTTIASRQPGRIFLVDPTVDEETLLVEACESLAAANDMAREISTAIDPAQRRSMLMLQQVIMLSELVVNRVLDSRRVSN